MAGGAGRGAVGQFPALMAPLGAARGSRRVGPARGKLPPGLRGTYLRNGPDSRVPALFPEATHWFDGDGMVHWVRLRGDVAGAGAGAGAGDEAGEEGAGAGSRSPKFAIPRSPHQGKARHCQ